MIFNRTMPRIETEVSIHQIGGREVIAIVVDSHKSEICATNDGRSLIRRMAAHGPECTPFYPHEHAGRRIDLRLLDYSRQLISWASWDDFDPLEIERLRQTITTYGGDQSLLSLDDHELVKALQLVESQHGQLVPNASGILLLAYEERLQELMPTARAAFQVLDAAANVLVNVQMASPLLKTLEAIEERFRARVTEQEVSVGLFRVPIPDYDLDGFREALNNAVLHRDYSGLGSIYVQLHPDHLLITNPGGFLEGITLDNLLTQEPKPRNQRLAEVFRRLGLVETTGRGIDRIFYGQLRYGRPAPDYSRSDRDTVRLELRSGDANPEFTRFVVSESSRGRPPTVWELIALNAMLQRPTVSAIDIADLTQRGRAFAPELLDSLVDRKWVEARGRPPNRRYQLSNVFHGLLSDPGKRVRTSRADPSELESMVLDYVDTYGRVTRSEVADLCNISARQASHLLQRLTTQGMLRQVGERRWTYYERSEGGA